MIWTAVNFDNHRQNDVTLTKSQQAVSRTPPKKNQRGPSPKIWSMKMLSFSLPTLCCIATQASTEPRANRIEASTVVVRGVLHATTGAKVRSDALVVCTIVRSKLVACSKRSFVRSRGLVSSTVHDIPNAPYHVPPFRCSYSQFRQWNQRGTTIFTPATSRQSQKFLVLSSSSNMSSHVSRGNSGNPLNRTTFFVLHTLCSAPCLKPRAGHSKVVHHACLHAQHFE